MLGLKGTACHLCTRWSAACGSWGTVTDLTGQLRQLDAELGASTGQL